MGRFAQKHPQELTALVGNAVANGQTAALTQRQLAAGTLQGWPEPYEMPLETVRYYGTQERKRRLSKAVTPEARENPKKAVDDLARLLLSAAQRGLESARPGIDDDPKALKEWGDALKTINTLVSDTAQTDKGNGKPKTKRREPVDPLTANLTKAASEPVPTPPSRGNEDTETGAQNSANDAATETHHAAGLPQGPADPSLVGAWSPAA